ncbi:MAG: hypothetical protein Q9227_005353 [Pyrenula ochraceoflavens]
MGFETAEKLRAHQRAKHDKSRFTCTECLQNADDGLEPSVDCASEYQFSSYALLQSHIAIAHPPICSYCPTSFTSRRELNRHLELAHGCGPATDTETTQVFPCTYSTCDKEFSKRGNLTVHIKTVHEGLKEFVCGHTSLDGSRNIPKDSLEEFKGCGQSFTSKSSLEEHVRTQHIGMMSRRAERQRKRKLETGSGSESKRMMGPRKKAKKPKSTFTELVGFTDPRPLSAGDHTGDDAVLEMQDIDGGDEHSLPMILDGYQPAVQTSEPQWPFDDPLQGDSWLTSEPLQLPSIDPVLLAV